jgi:putative RecB family exonuclease
LTIYSYSRISTFQNCPYQYKLQYIDKIKVEEEGIEAFMGSRVHETLERLYKNVMLSKIDGIEELVEYYNKLWEKKWHDKVIIVKSSFTPEHYRILGEKAIRAYYEQYYPFDQSTPLCTEKKIVFNLGDENHKMLGIIDRLDKTENGTLEIHDYKSSGRLPTQAEVDIDKQLALYQLAVHQSYPNSKKIILVWHYVQFGAELRSTRSKKQLKQLQAEYRELIDEIGHAKKFPTSESILCKWCSYQRYCPAKKRSPILEDFF